MSAMRNVVRTEPGGRMRGNVARRCAADFGRGLRLCLGALGFVFALALAGPASAQRSAEEINALAGQLMEQMRGRAGIPDPTKGIEQVSLRIEPHEGSAHYAMTIRYEADPGRREGFKFFGRATLQGVRITDRNGARLGFAQPSNFREERLDFQVPPATDDPASQTVVIEFVQSTRATYGLNTASFDVPWVSQWGVPVGELVVDYPLPAGGCHEGFFPEGEFCRQRSEGVFPVTVTIEAYDHLRDGIVATLALLLALALLFAQRRHQMLKERGILPVVEEVAYIENTNYRAPAMVSQDKSLTPELAGGDEQWLRQRMLWTLVLVPLPMLAVLSLSGWLSPTTLAIAFSSVVLVVAWVRTRIPDASEEQLAFESHWQWLVPAWLVSGLAFVFGRFGSLSWFDWLSSEVFVTGGIIVFALVMQFFVKGGSGSSGYSSCGGGCGSSCGGGGGCGGGCGGCGG